MKKFASAKYYKEQEARIVEAPRVVTRTVLAEKPARNTALNNATLQSKQLKQYDALKLEAMRLERDAQKTFYENAKLEGDKLKKESEMFGVKLEMMKLELAMRRQEAAKLGVGQDGDEVEIQVEETAETTSEPTKDKKKRRK